MPDAVDEIRKLSPEERIKRLAELEEERRKEIEAAEGLIRETVRELEEAEEKKKIPIPEARATDMSMVETLEGKQVVATHHFLDTTGAEAVQQKPQRKSLEEVAAGENVATPKTQQEGVRGYSTQRAAFAEYVSSSKQTVTGGGAQSPIEEKITDFYRERATSEMEKGEDEQHKYFGQHQQVTGGYEVRKREEEDRKEFYKRRGGPA